MQGFRDRRRAGRALAARLRVLGYGPEAVVLALLRGGVPVGFEVAAALDAPLDVLGMRKPGKHAWQDHRPFPAVKGKAVVLVDDGAATGATMTAAVQALRSRLPRRVIAAAPVMSVAARDALAQVADVVIAARLPDPFPGVAACYVDFTPTTYAEDRALLDRARRRSGASDEATHVASA